jgi:uncharacterized protein (DUF433 family)
MKRSTTSHIESRPGKCGGKPCITGTRIRVWDIYISHERLGNSADQIIAEYPQLTLADVHAALAYYYDHKSEIDAQMKADQSFVEQLKTSAGPGPLATKLSNTDVGNDSISS